MLLLLEKVPDKLFFCFRCLLIGFIDRSVLSMLGLALWVVKFCLLEGFRVFLSISAYVSFSVFSVSSIVVAFICAFGLYFRLLNFANLH